MRDLSTVSEEVINLFLRNAVREDEFQFDELVELLFCNQPIGGFGWIVCDGLYLLSTNCKCVLNPI